MADNGGIGGLGGGGSVSVVGDSGGDPPGQSQEIPDEYIHCYSSPFYLGNLFTKLPDNVGEEEILSGRWRECCI